MAEDAKIGNMSGGDKYDNETVKKSPLTSKNLNKAIGYLTLSPKWSFT